MITSCVAADYHFFSVQFIEQLLFVPNSLLFSFFVLPFLILYRSFLLSAFSYLFKKVYNCIHAFLLNTKKFFIDLNQCIKHSTVPGLYCRTGLPSLITHVKTLHILNNFILLIPIKLCRNKI